MDAQTGQIVAAALTPKEVDGGSEGGPLLDPVARPVASVTGDGAYDQQGVSTAVAERYPAAAVIVPPRSTAVPGEKAETARIPDPCNTAMLCARQHDRGAIRRRYRR